MIERVAVHQCIQFNVIKLSILHQDKSSGILKNAKEHNMPPRLGYALYIALAVFVTTVVVLGVTCCKIYFKYNPVI